MRFWASTRDRAATCATILVSVLVAALAGCGSDRDIPPQPPAGDDDVLAQFIDAEKQVDAAQLATALGAGGDLDDAADALRFEWDAGRQRILASLGPDGVVTPDDDSGVATHRFTRASALRAGAVADPFDFASMAWATWSLGLLYLGNDADGTVEHGPATSGDVTTTESTTVTAAKQGPVAQVMLSTTRAQTSTAGWSVSQTGTVELELPLCPDEAGVIAFEMHLELTTAGTSSGGGRSAVTDTLTGRTVARVDDDAHLASIEVNGTYDHNSSAEGQGLTIAAGQAGIRVEVSASDVTGTGSGDVTDAQIDQARGFGASLLRLAGSLAAARAGDFYEHGYCTVILVSPDDQPTEVEVGATQPFDVRVRHKWEEAELTDRITAQLDGAASVSPTGRTPTPATLEYVAPNQKNQRATIHIESRSRRGVALKDVAVKTPGGYAIHDIWMAGDLEQHMDAVNCDSPYGPWHVVISGDLSTAGWSSLDAFYDIVADPSTGTGTLTGAEHSVTTSGDRYDGTSTGTVHIIPSGEGFLLKMEIDDDIIWTSPFGEQAIGGHKSRELKVIPATPEECP